MSRRRLLIIYMYIDWKIIITSNSYAYSQFIVLNKHSHVFEERVSLFGVDISKRYNTQYYTSCEAGQNG